MLKDVTWEFLRTYQKYEYFNVAFLKRKFKNFELKNKTSFHFFSKLKDVLPQDPTEIPNVKCYFSFVYRYFLLLKKSSYIHT